jgi:hypothetical protein
MLRVFACARSCARGVPLTWVLNVGPNAHSESLKKDTHMPLIARSAGWETPPSFPEAMSPVSSRERTVRRLSAPILNARMPAQLARAFVYEVLERPARTAAMTAWSVKSDSFFPVNIAWYLEACTW